MAQQQDAVGAHQAGGGARILRDATEEGGEGLDRQGGEDDACEGIRRPPPRDDDGVPPDPPRAHPFQMHHVGGLVAQRHEEVAVRQVQHRGDAAGGGDKLARGIDEARAQRRPGQVAELDQALMQLGRRLMRLLRGLHQALDHREDAFLGLEDTQHVFAGKLCIGLHVANGARPLDLPGPDGPDGQQQHRQGEASESQQPHHPARRLATRAVLRKRPIRRLGGHGQAPPRRAWDAHRAGRPDTTFQKSIVWRNAWPDERRR